MTTAIHVGDMGLEIVADCLQDISAATDPVFLVKKPSGVTAVWKASLNEAQSLSYVTQAGDLNEAGIYKLHPHFTLGNWTGSGKIGAFEVKALYA